MNDHIQTLNQRGIPEELLPKDRLGWVTPRQRKHRSQSPREQEEERLATAWWKDSLRPRAIRHIDQARLADQETDADTPEGLKQAAEKNRETLKALKKSLEPETKDADADKENGEP